MKITKKKAIEILNKVDPGHKPKVLVVTPNADMTDIDYADTLAEPFTKETAFDCDEWYIEYEITYTPKRVWGNRAVDVSQEIV